jgi:hypothetical protein
MRGVTARTVTFEPVLTGQVHRSTPSARANTTCARRKAKVSGAVA